MSISKQTSARLRVFALLLHRYVGLLLVLFLTTAGLTGTVLVFYDELDALVSPELFEVPPDERNLPDLEPFELAAHVESQMPPGQHFRSVQLDIKPGSSITGWVEEKPEEWHEWFISPKSGRPLGVRLWGDITEGKQNLLPFIYRLHYSLALGDVGLLIFGIAALLWTIDCFVGAYLTFPQAAPRSARPRNFFIRWLPAWTLRTNKLFSLVFTWHRASGLWIWAVLLVFAWSAVGFNLEPIYHPVMNALVGLEPEGHELLPELTPPFPEPKLTLREAHKRGREEMAREAKERGFSIQRELELYYADDHGAYGYSVQSSLDISDKEPQTEVYIDGQTGRFLGFSAATGISPGNTISNWLFHLHMGAAFGLWYRILVSFIGLSVVGLSVTGFWIWWRKRSKSRAQRRNSGAQEPTSDDREQKRYAWPRNDHKPSSALGRSEAP